MTINFAKYKSNMSTFPNIIIYMSIHHQIYSRLKEDGTATTFFALKSKFVQICETVKGPVSRIHINIITVVFVLCIPGYFLCSKSLYIIPWKPLPLCGWSWAGEVMSQSLWQPSDPSSSSGKCTNYLYFLKFLLYV